MSDANHLHSGDFDQTLADALERFASRDEVFVALDFDGTLSEIVDRPMDARPAPGAIDIVERLAALPGVTVSLVSGRGLKELAELSGPPAHAHLIGGHGAQYSDGLPLPSPAEGMDEAAYERVLDKLRALSVEDPGLEVERKATGVALHYRRADAEHGERVAREAERELGAMDGVHVKTGKKVVEFSLVDASKGKALEAVRQALDVEATLFIGDDVTDEEGFAVLGPQDVSVKVGEGATRATHRVADPGEVVQLLAMLLERRQQQTKA